MRVYAVKPGRYTLPNGNTQVVYQELWFAVERVPVANGFELRRVIWFPSLGCVECYPPVRQPPEILLAGGAAFFIIDTEGRFWDGLDWTADRQEAYLFTAPPDPYGRCQDVVTTMRRLGWDCLIAYAVPGNERAASQVMSAKLPDAEPLRQKSRE